MSLECSVLPPYWYSFGIAPILNIMIKARVKCRVSIVKKSPRALLQVVIFCNNFPLWQYATSKHAESDLLWGMTVAVVSTLKNMIVCINFKIKYK